MEVWDDLWFWGFISQRSDIKGNRSLGWNEGKYWIQLQTNKEAHIIDEIKLKVVEFINLLNHIA